jgi:hypothetical protein
MTGWAWEVYEYLTLLDRTHRGSPGGTKTRLRLLRETTGPARRSGPRGERTVIVAARLTPAEHARWTAAATAGGRGSSRTTD